MNPSRSLPLLLVVLAQLCASLAAGAATGKIPEGDLFPDFSLRDRKTGATVRLGDFMGKIVVVECFAWWCSPACTEGTPLLHTNVTLHYRNRGGTNHHGVPVQVITVNFDTGSSQRPGDSFSHQRTDVFISAIGLGIVLDDPQLSVFDAIDEVNNARVVVINLATNSPSYRVREVVVNTAAWNPSSITNAIERVTASRVAVAPKLTAVPTPQLVSEGGALLLRVKAEGLPHPGLQWKRNGQAIPGGTNDSLQVFQTRLSDAGNYSLAAVNSAGSTESPPAAIRVLPASATPSQPDVPLIARVGDFSSEFAATMTQIHVDTHGRLTVLGEFDGDFEFENRATVARFLADGRLDPDFAGFPEVYGKVLVARPLASGGWLLGGNIGFYDATENVWHNSLIHLHPDGQVDDSFLSRIEGGSSRPYVSTLLPLAGGSWLVAGDFQQVLGSPASGIATLAAGFGRLVPFAIPGIPQGNAIESSAILPDGRLLLGLNSRADGRSAKGDYLVRLRADGSLDASFSTPHLGPINDLAVTHDGSIWVAGDFAYTDGNRQVPGIMRLRADGTKDPAFHPAGAWGIRTILPQPDGGAVLGGYFSSWNNKPAPQLVRLSADGQDGPSFADGIELSTRRSEASAAVTKLVRQADGELLVGGTFDTVNGYPVPGFFRLHGAAAGTGTTSHIALQPDGRLRFQALTAPGRSHRLQSSTDLKNWTDVTRFQPVEHTTLFENQPRSKAASFYRVVVE